MIQLEYQFTRDKRMILGYSGDGLNNKDNKIKLYISGSEIKVKILDCETYNYNWIEEGVDPNLNKVVHFKGGRHSGERFIELVKTLGLDKEVTNVMKWHEPIC